QHPLDIRTAQWRVGRLDQLDPSRRRSGVQSRLRDQQAEIVVRRRRRPVRTHPPRQNLSLDVQLPVLGAAEIGAFDAKVAFVTSGKSNLNQLQLTNCLQVARLPDLA